MLLDDVNLHLAPPPPAPAPTEPLAATPAARRHGVARPHTVFMLLRALPAWTRLDAEARDAVADDALLRLCREHPRVQLRFYEAGPGPCTDLLVWDAADVPAWQAAHAALRSHALLAGGYFELLDLIRATPDGWRDFAWARGLR
jgi:hypothetical protein